MSALARCHSSLVRALRAIARQPVRVRRRGGSRGFTLIELLLACTVIAVIAGLGVPAYSNYRNRANVARAIDEMTVLSAKIDAFYNDTGSYPASLANVGGDTLRDPYGRPYQYLNLQTAPPGQARKDHSLVPINTDYDLYSLGKDGQSSPPLTAQGSRDDIVRANNGRFIGGAWDY